VKGATSNGDPVELSVIIPTYNEADNVPVLLERLRTALGDVAYEVIVVDDDSPDGTWRVAQSADDPAVRVLRRIGRRGLSSAVLEGLDAADGSILAVLDADLQHDEAILPDLVAAVRSGSADIAIGSREAPGGSYGEFGRVRRLLSFVGARVASLALGVGVSDPMSGYFVLSSSRYTAVRPGLNPRGFKILLDLVASGQRPRVVEVGYTFRARRAGETKLSGQVVASFGLSVAELTFRRLRQRPTRPGRRLPDLSPTFTTYVGVVVMATGFRMASKSALAASTFPGGAAWLAAAELGLLAEYATHQAFTFPVGDGDRPSSAATRLTRFHLIAASGFAANVGIERGVTRLLVPPVGSYRMLGVFGLAVVGVMVTIVTTYRLNRAFTWPAPKTVPASPDPLSPSSRTALPSSPPPGDGRRATDGEQRDRLDASAATRSPEADQHNRPMTPSTSDEISSTARR